MKKISLPTLAEVKAGKVNLKQLEAYAAIKKKAGVSKPPIDNEYHQAMSELFKSVNDNIRATLNKVKEYHQEIYRTATQPFVQWCEKERVHLDACSKFHEIIDDALQNPTIKKSDKMSAMIKSLVDEWRNTAYYDYDKEEAVFARVIEKENSRRASIASKKSHKGRASLKNKTKHIFMSENREWDSIAAAVGYITPKILKIQNEALDKSRPLATSNAARTVRDWLSEYVANDKDAAAKLTEKARSRLKKGKR